MKINFTPTKKQHQAFQYLDDDQTTEILYGGAAGGGKSYLGCAWVIINALRYPGTRWLIGRSKLTNLKSTTLKTFFDICKKWKIKEGENFKYNSQQNLITLTNGSEIFLKDLMLYPSDPEFDSLGSLEITGAFVDEVNQCTKLAVEVLQSRIRYRIDEYNLIPKIYMSCNPSKNWVYNEFYKPFIENSLPEFRKFIPALLGDNRHVSKHYKEQLMKMNNASRERLLNGNWDYDDDPAYMFSIDDLRDVFQNTHVKSNKKYISIDVARKGKDLTTIFVWDGLRVIDLKIIDKATLDIQKNQIVEMKNKYSIRNSNIVIDEDGVGGGLVDMIPGSKGFVNNSRPFKGENFVNLKSQCYFKLEDIIKSGEMYVSPDVASKMFKGKTIQELIIEELSIMKQKNIDSDGKLSVISKKQIKDMLGRSPDFADALMLRMYFEFRMSNIGKVHFL